MFANSSIAIRIMILIFILLAADIVAADEAGVEDDAFVARFRARLRRPSTLIARNKRLDRILAQISNETGVRISVPWKHFANTELKPETLFSIESIRGKESSFAMLRRLLEAQAKGAGKRLAMTEAGLQVLPSDVPWPMITRSYDMSRLVTSAPATASEILDDSSEAMFTRTEMMKQLRDLVPNAIGELRDWKPTAARRFGVTVNSQYITLRAPVDQHDLFRELLGQLLAARELAIHYRIVVLDAPGDFIDTVEKEHKLKLPWQAGQAMLSNQQFSKLLQVAGETKDVHVRSTRHTGLRPRKSTDLLLPWKLQDQNAAAGRAQPIDQRDWLTLPNVDDDAQRTKVPHFEGMALSILGAASWDRRFVLMDIDARYARPMDAKNPTSQQWAKFRLAHSLAKDKQALLIRQPLALRRLVGVKHTFDPFTNQRFTSLVSKPDMGNRPPRDLCAVVQPTLIIDAWEGDQPGWDLEED